jgi:hypothetical protein
MMLARREGLFSPFAVAVPRPLLFGLLMCTGDRTCFRKLCCLRSPGREGLEGFRPDSSTRNGSWWCGTMVGGVVGDIAAESDAIR